MALRRVFLFPGQGSQQVGMGSALKHSFPYVRPLFEEVDDVLGRALSRLMEEGPLEDLSQTQNAQPALMLVSLAILKVLGQELGLFATQGHGVVALAGHSLGEISALAAGESLNLAEAARLLDLRGRAMAQASAQNPGGMVAALGTLHGDWADLPTSWENGGVAVVANDNAPDQKVLSGNQEGLQQACAWAQSLGIRKMIPLNVSGAFHSPLMAPARAVFLEFIQTQSLAQPHAPVVTNLSAQAHRDPTILKSHLVDQLCAPVRWRETMETLNALAPDEWLEVGPGAVLGNLVRRNYPAAAVVSLGTEEVLTTFLKKEGN